MLESDQLPPPKYRPLGAHLRRAWVLFWASPNTLLGLILVLLARVSGGGVRIVEGVIEAHGGWVTGLLNRQWPSSGPISAITFGHVVVGQTAEDLRRTRRHERVHVAQYERWGPLFLPAYFFFSGAAWWRGDSAYRGNRFEVQAYAVDDPNRNRTV